MFDSEAICPVEIKLVIIKNPSKVHQNTEDSLGVDRINSLSFDASNKHFTEQFPQTVTRHPSPKIMYPK